MKWNFNTRQVASGQCVMNDAFARLRYANARPVHASASAGASQSLSASVSCCDAWCLPCLYASALSLGCLFAPVSPNEIGAEATNRL